MLADLIELARENSSEHRRELLGRIADVFFDGSAEFSDPELVLFCDVLGQLVDRVDALTRAELSERVADSDRASRQLHLRLARDQIEVAAPVLTRSARLRDGDLIEIASGRTQDHLMAISRRATLSTAVTDVLVDCGEAPVLTSVAGNPGADISDEGFARLADRAGNDSALQTALSYRGDMPPQTARRVMAMLPEDSRTRLAALMKDDRNLAGSLVERADRAVKEHRLDRRRQRVETLAAIAELGSGSGRADDLLEKLAAEDRPLDVALVLSKLSALEESVTCRTLLRVDGEPLALLLKSLELPRRTVDAIGRMRCRRLNLPDSMRERLLAAWRSVDAQAAGRAMRFTKLRSKVSQ